MIVNTTTTLFNENDPTIKVTVPFIFDSNYIIAARPDINSDASLSETKTMIYLSMGSFIINETYESVLKYML